MSTEESAFMSFDSFGEMMEFMRQNEEAAIAKTLPAQQVLADGGEHWYYRHARGGLAPQGVDIFGHIPSLEDTLATERSYYAEEMDEDERAEYYGVRHGMNDKLSRGYVFGRHFSIVEPEGELGTVHVSQCIPISKEAFEEARAARWQAGWTGTKVFYSELRAFKRHMMSQQ